jgi:hypothetical protein
MYVQGLREIRWRIWQYQRKYVCFFCLFPTSNSYTGVRDVNGMRGFSGFPTCSPRQCETGSAIHNNWCQLSGVEVLKSYIHSLSATSPVLIITLVYCCVFLVCNTWVFIHLQGSYIYITVTIAVWLLLDSSTRYVILCIFLVLTTCSCCYATYLFSSFLLNIAV